MPGQSCTVVASMATIIQLALASLRDASALPMWANSELCGQPHGKFALKTMVYSCITLNILMVAVFLAEIQCIVMCLI